MLVTNPTSSARDRSWFVAMNSSPFKELYPSASFFAKYLMNGFLSHWRVARVASVGIRYVRGVAAVVFDNRWGRIILRPAFIFWRFFDARPALPFTI